ncbi:damage-control phosphatase ARMT1 family protein [Streptomyces sp. NBC_01166]|uniref:damage-control phosphatase ARMT1 family protein n=1 Tax=Streptomyces sp. NBC_01166 TaxID=2903755 RepID=UPI00387049FE|nr:damage-control phosphatase ARMT1 family protein [Streptomyces sp. NBC_01166]
MGDTRATSRAVGDLGLPPVITCREPGSFARGVMAERHPALIGQVREAFPYGPRQHRALDTLLHEIVHGAVEPLGPGSPDRELWLGWGQEHFGRPWFDAPFLWGESYFYRRLLGAVGYFDEGPWQGVDPFASFKRAELRGPTVEEELRSLDDLAGVPAVERAAALLQASLWGNRADLGFRGPAGESTPGEADPGLVADDSAALWSLLPAGSPATVAVIADNTGRELIPDLVLIDHLLEHGHADRVVLHVKPGPYYVSDAMTADVVDCLRRLNSAPGEAGAIGVRVWEAMGTGRLEVRTHPFFCAPFPYERMPGDLRAELGAATLTILKGDLNYRRLVGDRLWPATTPFADLTAYFPSAVAALRTLKSDVVVGLDPRTLESLDRSGREWRTSGTHALVQVRSRPGGAVLSAPPRNG